MFERMDRVEKQESYFNSGKSLIPSCNTSTHVEVMETVDEGLSSGFQWPHPSNASTCALKGRLTWARESDSECAGSVETTSVWCPSSARRTAREAARLVLPTPPLPLTIKYFRSVPEDMASKADVSRRPSADATCTTCRILGRWGMILIPVIAGFLVSLHC